MNDYKPEILELLTRVEQKYAKPLKTSNDFNALAFHLKHRCNEFISPSTLKRLWGYVDYPHTPRLQTLDKLSHYLGFNDFKTFCESNFGAAGDSSALLSAPSILSEELPDGARVEIGWAPNRRVGLTYQGNFTYEVTEVYESKLQTGDRFQTASFILGQPLSLPYILRHGQRTPAFIAGRDGGLTILKFCDHVQ